jgi:SAM-dependent methyltransferase
MVHALKEIRRVLAPGGVLLDLRPVGDRWPVEVVNAAGEEVGVAGRMEDLPAQLADDAASADALARAARAGWFVREREEFFDFFYYWDTVEEMKAHVDEKWAEYVGLPDEVLAQARRLMGGAGAGGRVRGRVKMLVARWRKSPER